MFIDYDMIPNIETGLDATSAQLLEALFDCSKNGKPMSNVDLIRFASKKNCRLPYDYEEILPTMAQDFVLNLPLLEAKGLIGNRRLKESGEWYRVTMSSLGEHFYRSIHTKAPIIFPIILVNGFLHLNNKNTAIPPHNLRGVVQAMVALMCKPEMDENELYKMLKGPDFPGGGVIRSSEVERFYRTGAGYITVFPEIQRNEQFGEVELQINALP